MATVRKSAESDKAGWEQDGESPSQREPENSEADSRGTCGPRPQGSAAGVKYSLAHCKPYPQRPKLADSKQRPFACRILIAGVRD